MAAIDDLINKISDKDLRARIAAEISKMQKGKKFGLVFESHLPECTPLHDVPVTAGKVVAKKNSSLSDSYKVLSVENGVADCIKQGASERVKFFVKDLVVVATFGEPIYPYLQPVDSVCNAPESDLWHTLIEADNYHALQLLDYLYHGKVDCIYIDPPYNTGAKDWKYNNNYVDAGDAYRHSKWLSFMEKRLTLAKKLLNPKDSVLIVTIDEKEYLHLGCLLEEMFPEARMQMITSRINKKASTRVGQFARCDEYLFLLQFGSMSIQKSKCSMLDVTDNSNPDAKKSKTDTIWNSMLRRGSSGSSRRESPNLFYPVWIDEKKKKIEFVGEPLPLDADRHDVEKKPPAPSLKAVWPIRTDNSEGRWQLGHETLRDYLNQGIAKLGAYNRRRNQWAVVFLKKKQKEQLRDGILIATGKDSDGSLILEWNEDAEQDREPKTIWVRDWHDASTYGTNLIDKIIPKRNFPFPKSLYAVEDTLRFYVGNKKDALIVDFFAGSGTTLHAVNLLNAEDGGQRHCIMITNNEVSEEEEAKTLRDNGYQPGDTEWENLGIARYVTWPRTKCSIKGVDINGNPLNDKYFTALKKTVGVSRNIKQISLNANILNKEARKSILALIGKENLPQSLLKDSSHYIISEKYSTSIVFDLSYIDEYLEELNENDHVSDIYIVTDNNNVFKNIKQQINDLLGLISKEEPLTFPMSDGFAANCAFFKLGFLDKTAISLGRQFKELLPLLWLKSGAVGSCPKLENNEIPDMLILPQNLFAVLVNENRFADFKEHLKEHPEINYTYIVTNYEDGYRAKI